uniref:NADH dehydrogenase subunit 5 n=1 Tax=Himalopsyche malenanda TaxID=2598966 RepID=UPI0022DCDBDD|nr:NADH dehydrogenase subunit 5 [Himalopsyche malenanda]UZZ44007.1 NADH dehydrogenase subunit 5 [Himalopsyche malenanda]
MMKFNLCICLVSFTFMLIFSFIIGLIGVNLLFMNLVVFLEWELVSINSVSFVMTFLFDWMSMIFISVVSLISSMVILYSKSYMSSELNMNRFIYLILLFVLSMIFMIVSPNLVSILLGWDGLGLVSYCLVIYYQNPKSYNSGMLTVLMNRIGDVMILMSIVWMLNFGGWNYIYLIDFMINDVNILIVSGLVVVAAMTKSAQIPFSSWLPAAMAAPTPISALVHSSTLVTAGVYLLIRFSPVLEFLFVMKILLLISGLTMFMSGISALMEYDLKKIIALSTLSQLGLMMMILSLGMPDLAFFHLLAHAFFKALLFMCAGSMIHYLSDVQDIRYMGGLVVASPMVSLTLNISNLALCGFPFMAGFYSKDLILEMFLMTNFNLLVFLLFFVSTGLTVSYTLRLLYYSMFYDFSMFSYTSISEDYLMLGSMMSLMILSVVGGSGLSWLIFMSPAMIYLTFHMKMMVMYVIFVGGLFIYGMIKLVFKFYSYISKFYNLTLFINYMWFFSSFSVFGLNYLFLMMGVKSVKVLDFGWFEYGVGQGIYTNLKKFSLINQVVQFNFLKLFLMIFVIYILVMVFLMILL